MNTITAIKKLLQGYMQYSQMGNVQSNVLLRGLQKGFESLARTMPELVQVGFHDNMSADDAKKLIETIRKNAERRLYLPAIPMGFPLVDIIPGGRISTPAFVAWQKPEMKCPTSNVVFEFDNQFDKHAREVLNAMLMNILLALPIKKVHLNFVDLNNSRVSDFFKTKISAKLWNKDEPIINDNQFGDFVDKLSNRMVSQARDAVINCVQDNKLPDNPFEIVVLYDFPNGTEYHSEKLMQLFTNASRAGIYFIVMDNKSNHHSENANKLLSILPATHIQLPVKVVPQKNDIVRFTPIMGCLPLRNACVDYINKVADEGNAVSSISYDYASLAKEQYYDVISDLDVEIGIKDNTDSQKVNFWLNIDKGHFHSFIIGKTGSGKSVLMHDIVSNLILKYKPEDLQLYLLDLKMAGPEFAKYSGDKHISALLRNSDDVDLVLALFDNIRKKMQERGKQITACGERDIKGYNKKCQQSDRLPQIVIVVDECQNLFNIKDRNIQDTINETITAIAREGRSQGVHFIMCTQTLKGVDINTDVVGQVSDFYIMKSDQEDAEKLIHNDCPNDCSSLEIGHVFYFHDKNDSFYFQSYNSSQYIDKAVECAKRKCENCKPNELFEFDGAQSFYIENKDEDALAKIGGQNLSVGLGRAIDIGATPVVFPLKKDQGQNILLFGIDEDGNLELQSSRVATDMLLSMIMAKHKKGLNYRFVVVDGYSPDYDVPRYQEIIQDLSNEGECTFVSGDECGDELQQLADSLATDETTPTVLLLLHPERVRRIRNNDLLPNVSEEDEDNNEFDSGINDSTEKKTVPTQEVQIPNENIKSTIDDSQNEPKEQFEKLYEISKAIENIKVVDFGSEGFSDNNSMSINDNYGKKSKVKKVKRYYDAIQSIIMHGPEKGVHVILQLTDPTNDARFWNGNYSRRDIQNYFNYRVMLKSKDYLVGQFAPDTCKIDKICDKNELLRAYFYDNNTGKYKLFSPYALPK